MLALTSLSNEMDALVADAEELFYNPLLYYGEGIPGESAADNEGDAVVTLSKLLPTLQKVLLIAMFRNKSCL